MDDDTKKSELSEVQLNKDENSENDIKAVEEKKKPSYGREILEMLIYFVIVIVSVLLIHQFVGQQIEVSGSSMENTLHNEDHLILEKITYEISQPKRYDIVVFRPYSDEKDTFYIKRVIGLPGETVQIKDSHIYINDTLLEEDYGNSPMLDAGIAEEPVVLGEDEYFLLGDNRNNSKDSRDESVGPVKRSAIMGRAWVRIWPLDKIGILEHQ